MTPSKTNPIYTVMAISNGQTYNLTSVLVSLSLSESKREMAQSAKIEIMNIKADGALLSQRLKVRDRVSIYANDGEHYKEVFRGFIWTITGDAKLTERGVTLKCYDNLIYLQESEDSLYFAEGKSTKDVFSAICSDWGVKLDYKYSSITHSKLALRGRLSDILTSDILDLVKDRTGKEYVIISSHDVMEVKEVGMTTDPYCIYSGQNAISAIATCTMDGMTTKVVILGKADKDERAPVEASVSKNAAKYGTLQKVITRDENTTLEDSKEEANNILSEDADPKWEYEVKAPDIPWIRKGDKVRVNAGDINLFLIVTEINHSISNSAKTMTLTLVKPKN